MASREEELQKKREEAERKARRGEIDPTHEFTFQVIKGFNIFLGFPGIILGYLGFSGVF